MKDYVWLIRREFWENRAIWIVPMCLAAFLIAAACFGRVQLGDLGATDSPATPQQGESIGGIVLFFSGVVFFAVAYVYSSWYLLDCLYADRKDRSILFWKSLPISDAQTVLSKLLTGLFAIPLVYFIAADVATFLMALVATLRWKVIGATLWHADLWLQLQALWLYLIVTMAIWNLPFAGWLLLVSAWAKRAVILWSILPLVAVGLAERWFLGTHEFARLMMSWIAGYPAHAFREPSHGSWVSGQFGNAAVTRPGSAWEVMNPAYFFASPATWGCALVGAALIAVAIQVRLRRTEA